MADYGGGDFGSGAFGVTPVGEGSYSGAEMSASELSACAVRGAVRVSDAFSVTYALVERVYLGGLASTSVSVSMAAGLRIGTSGWLSEAVTDGEWGDGIVLRGNSGYESSTYTIDGYAGLRVQQGTIDPAPSESGGFARGTFRAAGFSQSSETPGGFRSCIRVRLNARISTNRSASIGVPVRVRQGLRIGFAVSGAVYHANFRAITGRLSEAFAGSRYRGDLKWEHPEAAVRAWAAPESAEGRWTEIPGVSGKWSGKQVLGLTSDG